VNKGMISNMFIDRTSVMRAASGLRRSREGRAACSALIASVLRFSELARVSDQHIDRTLCLGWCLCAQGRAQIHERGHVLCLVSESVRRGAFEQAAAPLIGGMPLCCCSPFAQVHVSSEW
jgi:hypothetical protein